MPPEKATDTFSGRLRAYRRLRGLTQSELAQRSGTDKGHIGRMETQADYEPSREVVRRLAVALDVPPWTLEDSDFRQGTDPMAQVEAGILALDGLSDNEKRALIVLIRSRARSETEKAVS